MAEKTNHNNISLDKAFQIIEYLSLSNIPLSVSEISQKLNFNRATTNNLLGTMLSHKYVTKVMENIPFPANFLRLAAHITTTIRWYRLLFNRTSLRHTITTVPSVCPFRFIRKKASCSVCRTIWIILMISLWWVIPCHCMHPEPAN